MTLAQTILTLLADGEFQSGPALGQATGCSRTAVWKAVQSLQNTGLEIYCVRGKGYRLAQPVELLNRDSILAALDIDTRQAVQQLDVYYEIDSTNARLLEVARQENTSGYVCIAECQHMGRGRRGRRWVSPLGGNLYLSLLWRFHAGATSLGGLSLAIAVAMVRALRDSGLVSAQLKWPNDILLDGHKLAGILLELSGESSGPCAVVVGVGLNIRTPVREMSAVDQPWTDLESALGKTVSRNELTASLLRHLVHAVTDFEQQGLIPFMDEWKQWDALAGHEIILDLPTGVVRGVARGVDENGALLLARNGELQRHHSGEVSVRLSANMESSGTYGAGQ
ncbi:MAG: bifunctional biotin--[acetyl-CoA-carboxylase] ligase/biotin operon repressor BirA [Gammaproteobacteria bacterium]|nr:bifunctional biotin--[acetyl-CoA-carboxylase] ligase/biotin operon repressor BirA [Gammaproteobacteria bacterium]MCF6259088.1 bifunctional biotin--[acetyl-CoA-carboxylase] ligase/biotin operon repressor BirA [Gammaproteobacteria bacterium]